MKKIGKGFNCADIDKNADWPERTKVSQDLLESKVLDRQIHFPERIKGLTPDKKTKQWWSKFAMRRDYYSAHMLVHHIARQTVDYANANPDKQFSDHILYTLETFRRVTNECKWKPKI